MQQLVANSPNAAPFADALRAVMEAFGQLAKHGASLRNPNGDDLAVVCARQAAHIARVLGMHIDDGQGAERARAPEIATGPGPEPHPRNDRDRSSLEPTPLPVPMPLPTPALEPTSDPFKEL